MKIITALFTSLILASSFSAKAIEGDYAGYDDFTSPSAIHDITSRVLRVATQYANAISCGNVEISPNDIAALHPLKSRDDYHSAKFAILWHGDLGCSGGSGSTGTNLIIVEAGYSFHVLPEESSPIITFASPRFIEKLVGSTENTIILDAEDHTKDDPNNFPSLRVRVTLQKDQNNNWNVINKVVTGK